jgi:hypothetical protein
MADWNSLLNGLNAAMLGAFGRDIVYAPQGGQQFTIRAIFEATHASEDTAPGVYAAVFVHASDLPVPPQRGDAIIVEATTYKLFDIEADQGGGMILRLRQS